MIKNYKLKVKISLNGIQSADTTCIIKGTNQFQKKRKFGNLHFNIFFFLNSNLKAM